MCAPRILKETRNRRVLTKATAILLLIEPGQNQLLDAAVRLSFLLETNNPTSVFFCLLGFSDPFSVLCSLTAPREIILHVKIFLPYFCLVCVVV
jgi:hypothetical protein